MSTTRLANFIRRAGRKVRYLIVAPHRALRKAASNGPTIRLGTRYGGWHIAEELGSESVAILCGAGEDLSFDLELQKRTGCRAIIVDPTPRAIMHFDYILSSARSGKQANINNDSQEVYALDSVDFGKIQFLPIAVWVAQTTVSFWLPADSTHVSHSIVNLQSTDRSIEVEADTLNGVCARAGVREQQVALLKLDIEGAEHSVIDWMCERHFLPKQLLVEFDEMNFATIQTRRRIRHSVAKLREVGYRLVHFDGHANCTFVRS